MRLEASDPTFIDVLIPSNTGRNDRLDRIDRLIDWPKVAALLDDIHAAPEGRPAYPPITMVKIIVLIAPMRGLCKGLLLGERTPRTRRERVLETPTGMTWGAGIQGRRRENGLRAPPISGAHRPLAH